MARCEGCWLAEIYEKSTTVKLSNGDVALVTVGNGERFLLRGCLKKEDCASFDTEITDPVTAECVHPNRRTLSIAQQSIQGTAQTTS